MKAIVALVALVALVCVVAVSAAPLKESQYRSMFANFIVEHKKVYTMEDFPMRYAIFKRNVDRIHKHNARTDVSYTLGMNKFGDLTTEEFHALRTCYSPASARKAREAMPHAVQLNDVDVSELPESVDWRDMGVVNPVKDQAKCGSCWAFSTTGAIESAIALSTGNLPSLSEQYLIDCAHNGVNNGCHGGEVNDAFKYIMQHGVCAEDAYPYMAKDGSCRSCESVASISSFNAVPKNEAALMAAVAQQPVSIAIDANADDFHLYKTGVFDTACGTNLDHAIIAVGYGSEDGKDYWLVRNSWGPTWGDEGYIKMLRNKGGAGQCGITLDASFPVV